MNLRLTPILISLSLLSWSVPASALDTRLPIHQFHRQHWSIEQGLPQTAVLALARDNRGFVWLGTQDGLARFDGVEFKTYDTGNVPQLPGDYITALDFDARGGLWIGTKHGLAIFDGKEFRRLDAATPLGTVNGFLRDGDGMLISSNAGLARGDRDSLTMVTGFDQQSIYGLWRDRTGMAVGYKGGVILSDDGGRRDIQFAKGKAKIAKRMLRGCGGLWVASNAGLYRVEDGALKRQKNIPEKNINALHCDSHGVLWAGSGGGLYRLRKGELLEGVDDERRFPHLWISAFLPGAGESLWIGTLTGGMYRLSHGRFTRYNEIDELPIDIVWALTPARAGGVWAGGSKQVVRYQPKRRAHRELKGLRLASPVMSLLEAEDGHLWVGTRTEVLRYTPKSGTSRRILDEGAAAIGEDGKGRVWLGGLTGLYRYQNGKLDKLGEQAGFAATRVRAIYWSRKAGLWVGTEQGAYHSSDGERFSLLDTGLDLDRAYVASFAEDARGGFWVGLFGGGLLRRDPAGNWWRYTEADGLLSDVIQYIATGRDGWLWFSTNKGVFRADPASFVPGSRPHVDVVISVGGKHTGATSGYCCNGGGSASGVLDVRGGLWLPSLDGVVSIATDAANAGYPKPTSYIESARYADRHVPYNQHEPLTIPKEHRDVSLYFSSPMYDKPGLVKFEYMLDGYDGGWQTATGQRHARYTNLPPGEHEFRVRARSGDGVLSVTPARWTINVQPRFVETPFFIGLLILSAVLLAYIGHRARSAGLYAQRKRLSEEVSARTRSLAEANRALAEANQRWRIASLTDPLTSLWNRRYLARQIRNDIARQRRGDSEHGMAFFLMDIDFFKDVNDQYGHAAGDDVLVELARRLEEVTRDSDYLVRWGGEEFLLVSNGLPLHLAENVAQRLTGAVKAEPVVCADGQRIDITVSLGYTLLPLFGNKDLLADDCWEQAVRIADQALYIVKRNKRDGFLGIVGAAGDGPQAVLEVVADDLASGLREGTVSMHGSYDMRITAEGE